MFQRYGLQAMTMDDVCRELSMSKKTLYQYFTNKADLVDQAVRQVFCSHEETMKSITAENENAIDRMIKRYKYLMQMIESHGPSMMFPLKKYYPQTFEWLFAQRRKSMIDALVQTVKDGQGQRLFRGQDRRADESSDSEMSACPVLRPPIPPETAGRVLQ